MAKVAICLYERKCLLCDRGGGGKCLHDEGIWTQTCFCLGQFGSAFSVPTQSRGKLQPAGRWLLGQSFFEMRLLHCLFLCGPQGLKGEVRQLGLD